MADLIHYAAFTSDGVLVGLYRSDIFPPVLEPTYGDVGGEQKVTGSRVVSRHEGVPEDAKEVSAEDYRKLVLDPLGWTWQGDGLVQGRTEHPSLKALAKATKAKR